jgi:hypothetical protein
MVRYVAIFLVGCLTAACGSSPLQPSRTVSITVKALEQVSDTPLVGAHVFVDEREVGITPVSGALAVTLPDHEVGIRVEYHGVRSIAGPVFAHPGNGEVWTFWFEPTPRD